jgi:hypothetical protein
MSIISEEIDKVRPLILEEGEMNALRRIFTKLIEIKPGLRDRYAAKLDSATTLEELRRLEKPLIRDFTA